MELITQLIAQLDLPAQVLDASGKVVLSNKEFCRLFSLPQSGEWADPEAEGLGDSGQMACPVKDELARALAGETVTVGPIRIVAPVGKQGISGKREKLGDGVLLQLSLKPLFNKNGEVSCVVCMANADENPDEKYENELLKIQKGENLEILASGVAHEFNNIFTGIRGLADLIKDEVDQTSEAFEFAQMIQQNIARGAELIQQLSSFARQLPHSLKPRRIGEYIEQAIPLMQIQIQRRINLETDIRTDAVVLIDKSRMDQALSNIMHNAKDAMGGQGKIIVTIDKAPPPNKPGLDLPADTAWIVLEIADSGPGIPDELLSRVIEPFFSTKEQGKSTGLGLSVTSRIITSHNGLMEIGRSEKLGGAAIKIFLPVEERPEPGTEPDPGNP